ncbi:hemagglutinin-like protein [Pusillimonas sp. T7-7]|uniref:filamentous hemagglutinin family protein n=1 Tax=Pusillimonas sp. (strain T7-7) TaxID=1007105 RepID=UPI0002086B41|nr:filamentous hemagglutinin family protein [Pusillimonas sp. T7-7]AEC18826.1 hemagglutinin-like protein [Pusillimonas sp. T7-7]
MPTLISVRPKTSSSLGRASASKHCADSHLCLTPLAAALAVLAIAGSLAGTDAQAQPRPFSSGWFAAKGAAQTQATNTGKLPNGMLAGINSAARQQQAARKQLNRSVANLGSAAAAIAAQQAAQAAAHAAAQNDPSVPDGLAEGGLKIDTARPLSEAWLNAKAPVQTQSGGHTHVAIEQTGDKAILNWETFNVGKHTTVDFKQQTDWAVLNRVNDPKARPSQIQGQIKGAGTVMIANANGVVFSGSSQVNVRNLVAAAANITDEQFDSGLYGAQAGNAYTPTFTEALGKVSVERGARINTHEPGTVTEGGGYVLLLGQEVQNAGAINTPKGQTQLAAGDSFVIRKGLVTDNAQGGTTYSTTRGNEVAPVADVGLDTARIDASTQRGRVSNSGLILASEGDITLAGHDVRLIGGDQAAPGGVAVSTTSVNARGTIHLLNSASDAEGRVTMESGSVAAIVAGRITLGESEGVLIEADGQKALDSQRLALIEESTHQDILRAQAPELETGKIFDNLALGHDRRDQSRIEIVSGGVVDFQGGQGVVTPIGLSGALALATGGQIAVAAGSDPAAGTGRVQLRDGAQLDVSGSVGVRLAMADNAFRVDIQGNELRDAPLNRDSDPQNDRSLLSSLGVWVDRRTLVAEDGLMYTGNGLLEVSGWLANVGHGIGEWTAQGGTIRLRGGQVLTQSGSAINVAGGTIDVQDGYLNQSWLRGADGRLYELSRSSADIVYTGLYRGYESVHARWGETATRRFYNPLIGPGRRWEQGYTVGRDAGQLILDTPTAVLQGEVDAQVYDGARQSQGPNDALSDNYLQNHYAVARPGALVLGRYGFQTTGRLAGRVGVYDADLHIGAVAPVEFDLDALDAMHRAPERVGTVWLDTDWVNAQGFGTLDLAVGGTVTVGGVPQALQLADGGTLRLTGSTVDIRGDVVARGGRIVAGNILTPTGVQEEGATAPNEIILAPKEGDASVTLHGGALLDVRGLWVNTLLDPQTTASLPWTDGGTVELASSQHVTLAQGGVIDASAGGSVSLTGAFGGGSGGSASLLANHVPFVSSSGRLTLDGDVRAYGVDGAGGGTLRLQTGGVWSIGGEPVELDDEPVTGEAEGIEVVQLDTNKWLQTGFSHYELAARGGLTVLEGAWLRPSVPVYRPTAQSWKAGGRDPEAALALWSDVPLFREEPFTGALIQRAGASLMLLAGGPGVADGTLTGGDIHVAHGAGIIVDPGQRVTLGAGGQVTVEGRIQAPGGIIEVLNLKDKANDLTDRPGGRSVWVGEHAELDAAGRAYTAIDTRGRRYGTVFAGGSIVLGSRGGDYVASYADGDKGLEVAADAYVVVRDGALLDVSGAQAVFDVPSVSWLEGGRSRRPAATAAAVQPRTVASDAGQIAMRSYYGIYNEGTLRAHAGGVGASGGELLMDLEGLIYNRPSDVWGDWDIPAELDHGRVITVSQNDLAWRVADGVAPGQTHESLALGRASLTAGQVEAGGFDSLSLMGRSAIIFDSDVDLSLGRALTLRRGVLAATKPDAQVRLSAPYVLLDGQTQLTMAYAKPVQTVQAFADDAALTIEGALIDVRNRVQPLFDQVTIASLGDLRMLAGTAFDAGQGRQLASSDITTVLAAPGDLTLVAGQIYPASTVQAEILAGQTYGTSLTAPNITYVRDATFRILQAQGETPAAPYSVFGSMTLTANKIMQGGTLRAPLGTIVLGSESNFPEYKAARIELLPGSLTSVSAAGMNIPYGGTADGASYTVNGVDPYTVQALTGQLMPTADFEPTHNNSQGVQGIALGASNIVSHAGSVLDLSGGGELQGAAFVAGRGGSRDALTTARRPGGQVYAIVPGAQTAPVAGGYYEAWRGDVPKIGQQITLADGVPGLPAGTYTLMPANYALLPGAFRVELGPRSVSDGLNRALRLRDGSWNVSGTSGLSGTAIRDSLFTQVNIASGDLLRTWSQYNETSYDAFQLSQAATFGTARPILARDGKFLTLGIELVQGDASFDEQALVFKGDTRMGSDAGHDVAYGASLVLLPGLAHGNATHSKAEFVITGPGSTTARAPGVVPISAETVNAVGAANLYVGGTPTINAPDGAVVDFSWLGQRSAALAVTLETGAVLHGGQVMLVGKNAVTLAPGSGIDTLGWGVSAPDTVQSGYFYGASIPVLVASNGDITLGSQLRNVAGQIALGDGAFIRSEGSIGFMAREGVSLEGAPELATRKLELSIPGLNVGSADVLVDVEARGLLPDGMNLSQDLLARMLAGDPVTGAPAIERLSIDARDAINFYGDVALSTYDAKGHSLLDALVLRTPAIYGWGHDAVRLSTDTLVWAGGIRSEGSGINVLYYSAQPGAVIEGGAGTGSGRFEIDARRIVLGYPQEDRPRGEVDFDRLMLGFSSVQFGASEHITTNNTGNLAVYLSGPSPDADYDPAEYIGTGGRLNLHTPLLTGEAGSVFTWRTGDLRVHQPTGTVVDAAAAGQGATQTLIGDTVTVDGAIVLPSGRLVVRAGHDLTLGDQARLNLSGRATQFYDVTHYGWGGDVVLESQYGSVVQQAGAMIDLSAASAPASEDGQPAVYQSDAGRLTVLALDETGSAGRVHLNGTLHAHGGYGFEGGSIVLQAAQIGADVEQLSADFEALNERLNAAGVTQARRFSFKRGNLTLSGDALRAREVSVAVDGGGLTVAGTINASGAKPGSIRLAARDGLTLSSTAVLNVRGTELQVDSYGQPIEAKNRGHIELTSRDGWLRLQAGATLDLSSPDGMTRGKVDLNAGRSAETGGDARIDAGGPLNIAGADSIALNAFWRYSPTDEAGTIVQDNGSGDVVNGEGVVGLDQIDARSRQFIDAALGNNALAARSAGLSAYGSAYHLRPGVEINSADTPAGNLTVKGDLDLARYRYGPDADRDPGSVRYGAGEVGSFVLRAAGDLTINGSISDGFGPAAIGADLRVIAQAETLGDALVIDRPGMTLGANTRIPNSGTLNFDIQASTSTALRRGSVTLIDAVVSRFVNLPLGTVVTSDVYLADGTLKWAAGTVLDSTVAIDRRLFGGDRITAGFEVPASTSILVAGMDIPAGTDLSMFAMGANSYIQLLAMTLPQGAVLPADSYVTSLSQPMDIVAAAAMLAPGSQSWSMRLVGGADTMAADTRALQTASRLAEMGNISLSNELINSSGQHVPSVLRTGTGSLELLAGGDLTQESLFGVYTAGSQVELPDGVSVAEGSYVADHGGDLLIQTQGDLRGYVRTADSGAFMDSYTVNRWLTRQGNAEEGELASWSIRYGDYVLDARGTKEYFVGFAGLGTLGGGNLDIDVGGNAGVIEPPVADGSSRKVMTQGLVLAVGGSGYVTDVHRDTAGRVLGGELVQTGGGDLSLRLGGRLNPAGISDDNDANGSLTNLRGDVRLSAGAMGVVPLLYGTAQQSDPRALDPYEAVMLQGGPKGGPVLVLGDSRASLRSRGDLVLGGVSDAGQLTASAVAVSRGPNSLFSLWRPDTAIELASVGGNLVPLDTYQSPSVNVQMGRGGESNMKRTVRMLPPRFSATAASGSLYYGGGTLIKLAPTEDTGQLSLLAGNSIYGAAFLGAAYPAAPDYGTRWLVSGAPGDADAIPNPFKPGSYQSDTAYGHFYTYQNDMPHVGAVQGEPTRIYAVHGDLLNVSLGGVGQSVYDPITRTSRPEYIAARPARVLAGGDIVNFGRGDDGATTSISRGLILNQSPTDVSMLSAGGDIFYAHFDIAGPGTMEVSAGGNIYQGNLASITSIGPIIQGDTRPGADIVVQAGLGSGLPGQGLAAYQALRTLYLNPANQADTRPGYPLADQPGKVAHTSEQELIDWLADRYGYTAIDAAGALSYFDALAPEQQRVFLRQVYFAELKAGGREYNDSASSRFGSYLRGRQMIDTLFPETNISGVPNNWAGDLTLFQGAQANAGIRTIAGGSIQTLVPGGQSILGIEGIRPAEGVDVVPAGLLTQGEGDIHMYSQGSILLGLSRVMTTFGGDIFAWSAQGDINAGRGAKTTVVYTPPKRLYDSVGNVSLSPQVPSSGAGIATLNPIAEVESGDIDLIAPLGTIDAGEAGIRVSGNINIAALQVNNAANIQVQGESTGVPVAAAVNTGALTSASAASTSAATAAQDTVSRARNEARKNQPSIFSVRVLGFGGKSVSSAGSGRSGSAGSGQQVSYRPDGMVQVLGDGVLAPRQANRLTSDERRRLEL